MSCGRSPAVVLAARRRWNLAVVQAPSACPTDSFWCRCLQKTIPCTAHSIVLSSRQGLWVVEVPRIACQWK